MSDSYYSDLGQDLAPMMGMPPVDQGGAPPQPPPMPPQMPQVQPPMNPTSGLDPFAKAQMDTAALMNGPNPTATQPGMPGPGAGMNNLPPGARPPMPPPQMGGGPPGGPQGPGPMPPPMPGQGPPTGNSVPFGPSTDYRTALGIAPTGQDRVTSALGGLGKGLSAAAGNSNKAGAVFSRGAGGAITGGIQEAQEQEKLKQGQQNQYFNQTSNAFKEAMTQKSADAKDLYWQARAQQYEALAKAGVKPAPYNADALNLARAENEARKNYASDRADLDALKGQLPPDKFVKRMEALNQGKGKYFNDAYKKYGVDPEKAQNIKTQGMTVEKPFSDVKNGDWYIDQTGKAVKKAAGDNSFAPGDTVKWVNPFDASKMDLTGFHQSVPNGAYYTTPAGLHQRTIPPPAGPDPQALQQSIQRAEQEENYTGGPQ